MLALRPDLVHIEAATDGLRQELKGASAERGAVHIERFVTAIVEEVRAAANDSLR